MSDRTVLPILILGLISCSTPMLWSQQAPIPAKGPEFPIVLQQGVTAGKTPVGSKIQGKLVMATLLDGTVIPRNATFTGEVVESVAKTATDPSRLAICMDSAQWKNGSAALKVYFTGWYYPKVAESGQDLQYGPPQPANRTWNGQGQYPDPNSKVYRPFPGGDSDKNSSSVPDTPSETDSKHRAPIKDVEVVLGSDGTIALTSKRSNLKLERYTTYVVSAGDTVPPK